MYCGNNALEPRLLNGQLFIGDRYRCFRKGVGKGLSMRPYSGNYQPIHDERIYCGKSNRLPYGYDRFGSNLQCFRKGVGVGKSLNR